MLTEQQVSRDWQKIINSTKDLSEDEFEKAEILIDELRPESPLRIRLAVELDELRKMHGVE